MTTNHLIGLISSICLGLVILWTYFRKNGKADYSKIETCRSEESYRVEGGTIHVVPGHPYSYTWNDGTGRILHEKEWWNGKVEDHKKVLEDIKKVEKANDTI